MSQETRTAELSADTESTATDEAAYTLESPAKCPCCSTMLHSIHVVRLLRTKVNFTSTLPRRGFLAVCPSCRSILPVEVATWLS